MVSGFVLCAAGIFLIAGPGWACLAAGLVLFAAGGLERRK
jgi:hypothetical protein